MKKFTVRLSWKPKPNRKPRFFLQNLPKPTDRRHFETVTTLKKWLPWQYAWGARYWQYLHLSADHSNPLCNQLPSCYCSHKASYSNFSLKIGCHGNVRQHLWTPYNTIPTAHLSPQPKLHLSWFSRFCTDDRRVSIYFTMGRPFPPKIAPSHGVSGRLSNIWFPGPSPPKSSTQTASWSVELYLQGSLVWQTDRQTDRPCYLLGNNRPRLCT